MFDLSHGMTCDSISLHDILIVRGAVLGVLFGVAGTIASSFESPAAFAPPARVRSAEGFCPPCAIMARPNPVVGGPSIGSRAFQGQDSVLIWFWVVFLFFKYVHAICWLQPGNIVHTSAALWSRMPQEESMP